MALDYTPKTPLVTQILHQHGNGVSAEIGYTIMAIEEEFSAEFKLPRGLMFEPSTMTDFFLPDRLLDKIVAKTNAYAKKNNSKRKYIPVKRKDILNFFAVYQYMGVVRLPSMLEPDPRPISPRGLTWCQLRREPWRTLMMLTFKNRKDALPKGHLDWELSHGL